jgi:hypothetical protein
MIHFHFSTILNCGFYVIFSVDTEAVVMSLYLSDLLCISCFGPFELDFLYHVTLIRRKTGWIIQFFELATHLPEIFPS